MKTIGFYSYKGGTGKSLLCANLAVCLSRLGKSCVLVDCDVESPSLHNKFFQAGKGAIGRGGFVGLIDSYFAAEDWGSSTVTNVHPVATKNVEQFLYELPRPWDVTSEAAQEEAGKIFLLAAGDVYQDKYWHIVWSPLWYEIFTLYDGYTRGRSDKSFEKIFGLFSNIKAALEKVEGAPEYMIIDLRAGASELSTTLINAWIDSLVYTFSFNEDSIGYLTGTFSNIWRAGVAREQNGTALVPFSLESVLSRVPTGIDYKGDRFLRNALRTLRMKESDLHVLHSDRDLEMFEEIRLGFQRSPQNTTLTHEYLRLFEKLIDPSDRRNSPLHEVLGIPADVEQKDRVFVCESEVGALINPNDGSRNVSFKVETFQLLLRGLEDGIFGLITGEGAGEQSVSANQPADLSVPQTRDWLTRFLHAAGRRCGEAFGKALAAGWGKAKNADIGVQAKLLKWCEFDSDVGFGRFEVDAMTIEIRGPKLIRCDIKLHESFLTPATDTRFSDSGDHRYCALMTGYVAGVLANILNEEVEVTHSLWHAENIQAEVRSESCIFEIRALDGSALDKVS